MGTNRSQRNQSQQMRIGLAPFLGASVFAVLILIPWTRSLGVGLMVLLGIPIFIGWIRARKLTDGSRGLTSVNVAICGLMVVVGAATMSPGAGSAPIPTETAAIAAPPRTTAPFVPQLSAPPTARVTTSPATPALSATPTTQQQPPTAVQQPARALVPPPAKVAPPTKATHAPTKTKAKPPAADCGGDYYTNSSGHCVHRPQAAPSAPDAATAKCKDGTYSFSEHRRGTCSGHGGVANWL